MRCYKELDFRLSFNSFIRPNTPYRVLTLGNTIYSGGGFYSMSCMIDSCAGILQNFVRRSIYREEDHSAAYMQLVQRIIVYLHQMYVVHNAGERRHIILGESNC